MEQPIFYQLSLVMVIAAVVCLLARLLRQPMIIAYILTGFAVGPSFLNIIHDHEAFESFSQIGITLLLFIIGLGLNVAVIKNSGKPVMLTFVGMIAIVGSLGVGAGYLLGFTPNEAIIMGSALLFSSTIIVIKALSDKREQNRLYGQLAIGILLIDDIVATLALLYVSAISGHAGGTNDILLLVTKGAILGASLGIVGGYIMPHLSKVFARNQELLYIFAIAWAFGIASAFYYAGFSIEVGALFAGVSVAHLPYVQAIATRLKPLRDFFIVLFFINLGEALKLDSLSSAIGPALIFSALALLTKPLAVLISLGLLGYTKQTSFKTALHVSQISEFSVILIVLAANTKLVSQEIVAIATLTALITIAVSAYLMKYDDELYRVFQKALGIFERSQTKREIRALSHYPLVLIGYHHGGHSFVETFRKMKKRYVVIDYNPDVIETLERQHINHLYGDVTDIELLEEIGLHKSELIISTLNNTETNLELAKHINDLKTGSVFICHATSLDNAEALYKAGASYVLMPHFIGDKHIDTFLEHHGSDKQAFERYRKKHLLTLDNSSADSQKID